MAEASLQNDQNQEQGQTQDQRRIWIVFSGLMLGLLIASLDQTVVATALPTIVSDLGGLNELSWVVTGYLLASTASTPLWGKLGDMYGRKRLFQATIVLFLVGSILCGISQNIGELIIFRAIQGLGGGGLIVLAQAIIADVVSPRERGRYQGIFGAVYGVTSVAGPLLGGFFVDTLSWRWVFYINLPIGAIALVVIAIALPASGQQGHHKIDYLGTVLLAAGATSLVLLTTFGGTIYPWGSLPIILLAVAGVVLIVVFIFVERRAAEPVLPLSLFRNRVFAYTSAIGFVVGFALFGVTTFLPLFLQVVNEVSPTISGLRMVPLMAGVLITSITSGQLITRWGRYKIFPIIGTALMIIGMFLLSRMDVQTNAWISSLYMLVLGLGLGLVMQVLVIAVQNAVDYRNLGAATSGATFFRSIGGSFGTAVFGAVFSNLLVANLASLASALPPGFNAENATSVQHLPGNIRTEFIQAYAHSLQTVFLIAAPIAAVAFILTLLLPEVRLKTTTQATDVGDAFAMPKSHTSIKEIERALHVLAGRESQIRIYQRLAGRAGIDLAPACCWLLFRVREQAPVSQHDLAQRLHVPDEPLAHSIGQLTRDGLIETILPANGHTGQSDRQIDLTPAGQETLNKLTAAYHQGLKDLLDGWSPEQEAELAALLNKLTRNLLRSDTNTKVLSDVRS